MKKVLLLARKFLGQRSKIRVILILVLIFAISVPSYFYIKSNYYSADIIGFGTGADPYDFTEARNLFANAKNTKDALSNAESSLSTIVDESALVIRTDYQENNFDQTCINSFNTWVNKTVNLTSIPCSWKILNKFDPVGNSRIIEVSVQYANNATINVSPEDIIGGNGTNGVNQDKYSGSYRIEGKSKFRVTCKYDNISKLSDCANAHWTWEDDDNITYYTIVNVALTSEKNVNLHTDLLEEGQHIFGNIGGIAAAKDEWYMETQGSFKSSVHYIKDSRIPKPYILTSQFCKDGCTIHTREYLHAKTTEDPTPHTYETPLSGNAETTQEHIETIVAPGYYENGIPTWYKASVHKVMQDTRDWNYDVWKTGAGKLPRLEFSNDTVSSYDGYPLQQFSDSPVLEDSPEHLITTTTNKAITYTTYSTYARRDLTTGELDPSSTYEQSINISDKTEVNTNGNITGRSGSGGYQYTDRLNPQTVINTGSYSGVFDSLTNQNLRITESNIPSNFVGMQVGDYINLSGQFDSYLPYFTNYFPSESSYMASGYFSAMNTDSVSGTTILQTSKYKVLPKNVVLMESFSDSDLEAIPEVKGEIKTINDFLDDLAKQNVNVLRFKTKSSGAMGMALNQVPPNSTWLINMGHGTPTGLLAGKDMMTFKQINNMLKAKDVKLNVFAADSCFAGRFTGQARTVIGSMSYGRGGLTSPSAAGYFGIGGNSWEMGIQDLVGKLSSMTPKLTGSCSIR